MVPRTRPCLLSASSANCEQVGTKRQAGGKSGEINRRYSLIDIRAISVVGVEDLLCMLRGGMPEEPGPPVQFPHNRLEGLGGHPREIPIHHDDQIDPFRHLASVEAKVLSKPPLYAIPGHRAAGTARDCQSQPPLKTTIAPDEDAEAAVRDLSAITYHFPELSGCANPIRLRKTGPPAAPTSLHLRDREPLSPFCPPAPHDSLAPYAFHPAAKSMSAFSLDTARLIRSLHATPTLTQKISLYYPSRLGLSIANGGI